MEMCTEMYCTPVIKENNTSLLLGCHNLRDTDTSSQNPRLGQLPYTTSSQNGAI